MDGAVGANGYVTGKNNGFNFFFPNNCKCLPKNRMHGRIRKQKFIFCKNLVIGLLLKVRMIIKCHLGPNREIILAKEARSSTNIDF